MTTDISTRIYPSQLLSFYEVLQLLGCQDSDSEYYSTQYDTWGDAIDDSEFVKMLLSMDYAFESIRTYGLQYWDSELDTNIDICVISHTLLYMVTPF